MHKSSSCARILIVGAGPVGLLLATELFRHGASCRVVERATEASAFRVPIVQLRALELLGQVGLAEPLIQQGIRIKGHSLYHNGRPVFRMERHGHLFQDTSIPAMVAIDQERIETLFRSRLQALGGEVECGVELIEFIPDDGHVAVQLRHSDGSVETVRTEFLVGCDGAASRVRSLLKATQVVTGTLRNVAVAHVRMEGDLPQNHVLATPNFGILFPLHPVDEQRFRVSLALPDGTPYSDETAIVSQIHAMAGHLGAVASDVRQIRQFRVGYRCVEQFRHGRCLLAGDAAHLLPPSAGQGLNLGIGDAFNLGWKLAGVAKGQMHPDLLDSYHAERHAVAMQTRSDDIQSRHDALNWLLEDGAQTRWRLLSQLDQHYRESPLTVQSTAQLQVQPGNRPPNVRLDTGWLFDRLRGTQHHLVCVGDAAVPIDHKDLAIHRFSLDSPVARAWGIDHDRFVLVRPDGYVAANCDAAQSDELTRYFGRIFAHGPLSREMIRT